MSGTEPPARRTLEASLRMGPLRGALAVGGVYAVLSALYIVASTAAARRFSDSIEDLLWLETAKGLLFVATMTVALTVLWYAFASRLGRIEDRLRERERALLEAQRHADLGLFAGSVAHDVNNVLSVLRAGIDELAETLPADAPSRPALEDMESALQRATVLTRRLGIGRGSGATSSRRPSDLGDLCREVVRALRPHPSLRGVVVAVGGADGVMADVDPDTLGDALANLVINGGEATGAGGRVEIMVAAREAEAVMEVHDNGPGVPAERVPEMFEPFTTSKAHGTGLGLFSVRGCLDRHGGGVAYTRSPLGGACFRLWLPLLPAAAATRARGQGGAGDA